MSTVEPNVILRGGPSTYLSEEQRICHVERLDEKLKLPRGDRYEHFEPTAESEVHEGVALRVFTWTGATQFAE
ncbi:MULTISPECIES: DUF5988 family protein [Streptomyces]|uniref:DUF5988 family protein n=1 Tax=Streptomyces TaxID=1883 RepID=UPI0004C79E31|nr:MULTISPECIES: DUF5988 family protein [unclassified Streptomyces]KPC79009.1 hypothetical protein ADK82_26610 [Streptomyces sp. NRRL S-4]